MVSYKKFPTPTIVEAQLIVNCVLAAIALLAVGLRIISRVISGAKVGWDDGLVLLAVPQGLAMLTIQGLWSTMGIGHPVTQVLENVPTILKLIVSYELLYCLSTSTIKFSVLLFYLRVFVNPGLRLAVKCTIALVALWTVGNILQVFLICRPFAATYDPTVKGECGNRQGSFVAIGAFNAITDVLILALPIRTVWKLKIKTGSKVGVTVVFLIGLLVSVVAIIRIPTLISIDLTGDLTGTMVNADFLTTLEVSLGIICVSLPMLGPVVSRYRPSQTTSNQSRPHITSSYGVGSSSNKFKRMEDGRGSFDMETIYASNKNTSHRPVVEDGMHPMRDDGSSFDGSEASLARRAGHSPL